MRAMYEAYSRNKYTSTGVIQWMLNNAWPSDDLASVRLLPAAGRRLFRRQESDGVAASGIRYDDDSIWVVSSQYEDAKGLKLTAKVSTSI